MKLRGQAQTGLFIFTAIVVSACGKQGAQTEDLALTSADQTTTTTTTPPATDAYLMAKIDGSSADPSSTLTVHVGQKITFSWFAGNVGSNVKVDSYYTRKFADYCDPNQLSLVLPWIFPSPTLNNISGSLPGNTIPACFLKDGQGRALSSNTYTIIYSASGSTGTSAAVLIVTVLP